ncbi:hypothetical protein [Paenibacillus sinopodophylli]|uniref:hypothetical protein n=1 Tax=Paenibacillus sinopodophylli TaxID=1837342 RepID=UPI00110D18DE|nr:hypothetical protein [Paenibacillus sinopodophylli]
MGCCIGQVIIIKNEGTILFGNAKVLETSIEEQAEETASGTDQSATSEENMDTAIVTGKRSRKKKTRGRGKTAAAGFIRHQRRKP